MADTPAGKAGAMESKRRFGDMCRGSTSPAPWARAEHLTGRSLRKPKKYKRANQKQTGQQTNREGKLHEPPFPKSCRRESAAESYRGRVGVDRTIGPAPAGNLALVTGDRLRPCRRVAEGQTQLLPSLN